MNRHFGNPRSGISDTNTRERAATCFAVGFIVIIGLVLIGGMYAASSLLG